MDSHGYCHIYKTTHFPSFRRSRPLNALWQTQRFCGENAFGLLNCSRLKAAPYDAYGHKN